MLEQQGAQETKYDDHYLDNFDNLFEDESSNELQGTKHSDYDLEDWFEKELSKKRQFEKKLSKERQKVEHSNHWRAWIALIIGFFSLAALSFRQKLGLTLRPTSEPGCNFNTEVVYSNNDGRTTPAPDSTLNPADNHLIECLKALENGVLGEVGAEILRGFLKKLRAKYSKFREKHPEFRKAIDDMKANPKDKEARGTYRISVIKLFEEDEDARAISLEFTMKIDKLTEN